MDIGVVATSRQKSRSKMTVKCNKISEYLMALKGLTSANDNYGIATKMVRRKRRIAPFLKVLSLESKVLNTLSFHLISQ